MHHHTGLVWSGAIFSMHSCGLYSADRQATLWCDSGLERGLQHCRVAGCQQHGWCRQSRVTISGPLQLLLLVGILLTANDSLCASGLDHTQVILALGRALCCD